MGQAAVRRIRTQTAPVQEKGRSDSSPTEDDSQPILQIVDDAIHRDVLALVLGILRYRKQYGLVAHAGIRREGGP